MRNSELTRCTTEQSRDVHADMRPGCTTVAHPFGSGERESGRRRKPRKKSCVSSHACGCPSSVAQLSRRKSSSTVLNSVPGSCKVDSRRSASKVPPTMLSTPRVASMRICVDATMS